MRPPTVEYFMRKEEKRKKRNWKIFKYGSFIVMATAFLFIGSGINKKDAPQIKEIQSQNNQFNYEVKYNNKEYILNIDKSNALIHESGLEEITAKYE